MFYTHLTLEDRYVITHLINANLSLREIARRLNRHHTTISREIKRAKQSFPYAKYDYFWTHDFALSKRTKARHLRRRGNKRLYNYVVTRLLKQWSPDEISGRIKSDYTKDSSMRISPEGIYSWIYLDASTGGTLYKNLRRRRKRRRKHKLYGKGKRFLDRKMITDRPLEVEGLQRIGDWEGDTIEGKKSTGYVATLNERKSRYLMAVKLENKKAITLTKKVAKAFWRIPKRFRKTLTVDNGTEFSNHKILEKKARIDIYFARPYAPWQRGANENTNGLLRQYFPKGTDFRKVTQEDVKFAVKLINNRPRKCLNYQTPHEVFWEAVGGALAI